MKIKLKLSLIVIAVMAAAITGISAFLLQKVSEPRSNLTVREIHYLTVLKPDAAFGMDGSYFAGIDYFPEKPDANRTIMAQAEETYIFSDAHEMSKFALVLAVVSVTVAALILLVVLGIAVSPIVTVK